jgi:hypothetical protein
LNGIDKFPLGDFNGLVHADAVKLFLVVTMSNYEELPSSRFSKLVIGDIFFSNLLLSFLDQLFWRRKYACP